MTKATALRQQQPEPLTPRQCQVLKLLADGLTNKQVVKKLKLSPKTVEAHRVSMMNRLNIHTFAGLVKYAIRVGLTSVE